MPTLSLNTPVTVAYSGALTEYTTAAAGILTVKAWGAGGAGGSRPAAPTPGTGGGGGFISFDIPVASGDIIRLEVGGGGKGATTTTAGGLGGWPDGGQGGLVTVADYSSSGGGGSTRVYKNGTLIGVAGGGGGGGMWTGGAGGGLVGQQGGVGESKNLPPVVPGTTFGGTGGTQTAGGISPQRPTETVPTGTSLQGGRGWSDTGNNNNTTGGGGGGGFYGGGGGTQTTAGAQAAGGGGSSYITPLAQYPVNRMGLGQNGADSSLPLIGTGGAGTTAWPASIGKDGQAYLSLVAAPSAPASLPANAKTVLSVTSASQFYTVPTDGVVYVKMWGGGGGGNNLPTTSGIDGESGATGGFTTIEVPVTAGQIIRFDVGQGGRGGQWTSGTTSGTMVGAGGNGGWPDGGAGGCNNRCMSGGGGGSSRIWIDGILYGLAAGGGGDGVGQTDRRPGAGGGLVGQDAINTLGSSTPTAKGYGGTQTTGGLNGYFFSDTAMAGNHLQGGRGFGIGASQTAHSETSGGGGGGGYYGGGAGGGGAAQTAAAGGGGGSSYIKAGVKGSTEGGSQFFYPGGQDDLDYIYGVGAGGKAYNSSTTPGPASPGGDGKIVFTYASNQTLVEGTKTTVAASGGPQRFIAAKDGVLKVKMWGGGGAAGTFSSTSSGTVPGTYGGGCGAFTYVSIDVKAGQLVQLDVAKGGGGSTYVSGTSTTYVGAGGAGGWPDGGSAGTALFLISAGGGGSSRVWVDGVLKAVAAGGGGGSGDNRQLAGGGGGATGQNTTSIGAISTGGTQWSGGVNNARADALIAGGYLRGGRGYPTGTGGRTTNNNANGYGGGGGYYGGAGGGQATDYYSSGSGGSSYIAPEVSGYIVGANYGFTAGGFDDPDYVSGVGKGGLLAANASSPPGGDGSAIYTFTPNVNLPVNSTYSLTATGASQSFKINDTGNLTLKLWGAGGGGAVCGTGSTSPGAGGGYTEMVIPVVAGQVIRFDVGKGGQGGQWTSGAAGAYVGKGGNGGFPDAGSGAFNVNAITAGGGGSSRVWIDGVLVGVAGGGGGSSVGTSPNFTPGGGGGAVGGDNVNTTTSIVTTGAGATFGGLNAQRGTGDHVATGRFGRGGDGFGVGGDQYTQTTIAGGGGGGGYYGGGGGGAPSTVVTGGSGGSGYFGVTQVAPYTEATPYTSLYASYERTVGDDFKRFAGYKVFGTAPVLATAQFKYGASSLYMAGAGHNAYYVPAFGTGDFTVEAWFKNQTVPTGGTGVAQVLFGLGEGAVGGFTLYQRGDNNVIFRHPPAGTQDIATATTYDTTTWHHWAVVRASGVTRVYRDGVLFCTQTTAFTHTTGTLHLGSYSAGGESRFNGWIDDLRVSVGVARYTAGFTPPSAPLYTLPTTTTVSAPTTASTAAGTALGVPGNTTATGYVSGVGVGGASRTTAGTATNGGDGLITYSLPGANGDAAASGLIGTVTVTPPAATASQTNDLPTAGQSKFQTYTGSTVAYQASGSGTYLIEMWGAGGGGVSANNLGGGGGGYTTYQVTLLDGDVVTVQVASGGGSGTGAGSPAGLGGYPDGGNGVLPAFTQFQGGGGGSSRLYINTTLVAVAGGGGGGAYGGIASDYQGGPGGGSSGVAGSGAATGGTQSAGGTGAGNGLAGGFLQGGNGGVSSGVAGNGPGGGGGYYGGGGGINGGAGGSGYFNTAHPRYVSGTTQAGVGHTPAGTTSTNYVAGVGTGSLGTVPGGAGRVNIYNNTPTPGNATGAAFPTITLTNPVGGVNGSATGAAFLPTSIAIGVPVGQNGIEADIHVGLLPEISTRAVEAIPLASAIIVAPINNSTFLFVTAPTIVPFSIEANVDVDTLDDVPVTLHAPAAIVSIPQSPVSPADGGDFTPVAITTTAPVAVTGTGASPSAPIGTIHVTLTDPAASATGDGQNIDTKTFKLSPIVVTMARAMVLVYGSPDGTTTLAVPMPDPIQVTVPDVLVDVTFVPTVDAVGEAFIDIAVTVPDGMGEAVADVIVEAEPFENDIVLSGLGPQFAADALARQGIATVTVTPPDVTLEAGADFNVSLGDLIVLISPPVHATEQGANIVAAMPAPIVINGADHEISMDVSAPLADPILIVSLDGMAQGDFGVNMPGPIIVTAPEFGLPVLAEQQPFEHDIVVAAPGNVAAGNGGAVGAAYDPTSILLTAPVGAAEGGIGVSFDVIDMPSIVLLPPQAGNQTSVNLSLPLPTVFIVEPVGAASGGNTIARPMPGPITLTAPVGGVRGLVVVSDLVPIIVTAPEGAPVVSIGGDATGEAFENAITLTAPAATATGAVDTRSLIGTIVVTVPAHQVTFEGAVVADLATDAPIVVTAPVASAEARAEAMGEAFTDITVTTVDGAAKGSAEAAGLIATIQIIPPDGIAYESKPADVVLDFDTPIVLHAPDATATVSGTPHIALPTITLTAPAGSVSGDAIFDFTGELVVGISPPAAFTFREAQVVVGFPTIYIRLPSAVVSGDTVSANVVAEMPTTYVFAPEAYANDGKLGRILFKRSQVAGRAPFVVSERELVLNEADGALYHRDANGEMTTTPFAALMEGLVPSGGTEGQVLMGDGSWTEPTPTYVEPIRFAPSGRAILSEGLGASATHAAPVNIVYRPFFVAKPFTISDLGVEVQTAAAGSVAHLGLCRWKLSGLPGKVLATGDVSTTSTGVKTVPVSQFLTVGWYAAMVAISGGAPTLAGYTAPTAFDSTFTPIGDLAVPYAGVLNPAPAPTTRDDAFAYLTAQVA